MKFEKINDTKIKIILTLKDIELNHVSIDTLFTNPDFSPQLLQTMLSEAEKNIGFVAGDSKLLVEATIDLNEEYIFTITKLVEENLNSENRTNSFIFKFENFDDYISLCTFLNNLSDLNLAKLNSFSKMLLLLGLVALIKAKILSTI